MSISPSSCDLSDLEEDEFWATMEERGWAYLWNRPPGQPNALPTRMSPRDLPRTISWRTAETTTMGDDTWRSFSGYSRKVEEDYVTKWWPADVDCAANAARPFNDTTEFVAPYKGCDIVAAVGLPAPDDEKCMRAFDRYCNVDTCITIPYFEYFWSFFFNDEYIKKNALLDTFSQIYDKPFVAFTDEAPYYEAPDPETATVETANLPLLTPWDCCPPRTNATAEDPRCAQVKAAYKQWTSVSSETVPLSRSNDAKVYRLPDNYLHRKELPGYVEGFTPIYYKDEDCLTAVPEECQES